MTVGTSPDRLPPGSNREFRSLKTGRRIMVVKSTEDDLPSGWIKEVEIRRNANGVRKDKYYSDPASGYVFRSKTSVLHYLETGEITGGAFLRKKGKNVQILSKADKSAVSEKSTVDDLPSGWIKEVKIKRNANRVRKDKYYIDPASGYVFRSKTSVLRYLETGEITGRAFLRKKGNDDQILTQADESGVTEKLIVDDLASRLIKEVKIKRNADGVRRDPTAVKENERPEWLPKNWLIELKTRKSGASFGKQFKVVIEKSTMDNLPSGWIMEVKIKSTANEIQKDMYYTDPARGYVFRSKKAVLCYLETGEIDKCPFLREKGSDDQILTNADESFGYPCYQLPATKRQKVKHLANRWQIVTGGETSNKSILSDLETDTFEEGQSNKDYAETGLATSCTLQIPQRKGSVENAVTRNPETTEKSTRSSSVGCKASNRKHGKIVSADNVLVSTAAADETEKRSSINYEDSGKSKNATRKFGKNEAKPPCVLVDEETRQLNVGPNATLPNQASPATVNPEINDISPHEDKTMFVERPQMLGTKKGSDSKSEGEPFFCSEPCLEFGIKTCIGKIPFEDSINEGLVSTPIANIQQQKNLADTRIEHSRCRKTLFNSARSKEDGSLHQRSSKRVARHAPELVASSLSNEQVLNFADRKSYDDKAIPNADLTSAELSEKSSQQLEIGPRMAYGSTLSHVESSNKSKDPRNNQTVPTQMNNERSAIPSWSSWSDPCFKSPFRTVADSSPAEGSFAFQRNLPDHGLPNIFRSDIPSHVDPTGKPVLQQQFPPNPPFLPLGNVSLPSSSTFVGGQQSTRKCKRNNKTR